MAKSPAIERLLTARNTFLSKEGCASNASLAFLRNSLADAGSDIGVGEDFRIWAHAAWQAAEIALEEKKKVAPDEGLIARLLSDFGRFMDNCINALRTESSAVPLADARRARGRR